MGLALHGPLEIQTWIKHGCSPLQRRSHWKSCSSEHELSALVIQCTKYPESVSRLEQEGWSGEGGQGRFLEKISHKSDLGRPEDVGHVKKNARGRKSFQADGREEAKA